MKTLQEYITEVRDLDCRDYKEFYDKLTTDEKSYTVFKGIDKSMFPKWSGWNIINEYKRNGIKVQDIEDSRLEKLVKIHFSFLFLKYQMCEEIRIS